MLLKNGSKGDDVKKLQTKLGIDIDGKFGNDTEKAVIKWQSENNLEPDGVVGNDTWNKMFKITEENVKSPLKLEKLKGIIPDVVLSQIPDTAAKFNITTPLRLAHFLSQCAHESGNFKFLKENLNYSASGLKRVFGKYFPGNLNESYAGNPEKIANRVYGNRMGNGNESSGDGYKYCGRGYIQLTGKDNYTAFDKIVPENILENPSLVATKYPLMSAAFFFEKNKLWAICDKGSDKNTIVALTKRINGGTNGLEDRIANFNKIYNALKS